MKRSLRLLIVFSVVASFLLFATPSQAVPTDKWVAAFGGTAFYVEDTSNLSVGSTVSLKTIGSPNNLADPFPGGVTITAVSVSPIVFNLCGIYTCPNSGGFANGDTVYAVNVNVIIFNYYTLAEFTFSGGASTAPGAPTSVTATATGTTTATVSFTAPASNGGSTILSYTATSSPGAITATISQAGSGTISITGLSPATAYTFTVTALNSVGASSASAASNSITTLATGISPMFSSASSYDGRFTVQVVDYDPAFTYTVTASVGTVSISTTGLITVTGLRPDQSVTVTVTTTRTGYASGAGSVTGSSQVAPMLPGTKPELTFRDTLITCTIGRYSATPTSAAFSLFVDGRHISTNFSALGELLPDWIIPWATSSTITRTATLTSATWSLEEAYKGKAITCATLGYSKNAIGLTASVPLVAR